MQITDLSIPGVKLLEFNEFNDDRGSFTEIFNLPDFKVAQINKSVSKKGVLRGIHFADVPPGQAKYVTCITGSVLDVLVDLRKSSPTFKQWVSVELTSNNKKAILVPVGVGHAFLSLDDESTVIYLCDQKYNPKSERELNPFDSTIAIAWPTENNVIQSEKDKNSPSLIEIYDLLPE